MFSRLRVKLTVLYAGLFCLVLFLIGATAYFAISENTQRLAREQLANTGATFVHMSELRVQRLHDNAENTARQALLQQAVSERNEAVIRALLNDLSERSEAELAFLVRKEGLIVGGETASNRSVSPGLQVSLEGDAAPTGLLSVGDNVYQAATAPIPGDLGWFVLGARIGDDQLEALEALSSTRVDAAVLMKRDGWIGLGADRPHSLGRFIDDALARRDPRAERTPDNHAIAFVQPLNSLDGTRGVLLLQYPLSSVLSPYGALFGTLIAISAVGIAMLIAGTWFLARSITQPLSTLEDAAKGLQQGLYNTVVVPTKDELSRLAETFNAMIDTIRERERKITQLAYHDTETRLP
ncbi:MAG TPA: HAMP domain-containing protein, partial [Vitreimonas sp.]|nr:HAMP domain-containing protein [Vitreimonas sp.]